jgi:hypothetical protein
MGLLSWLRGGSRAPAAPAAPAPRAPAGDWRHVPVLQPTLAGAPQLVDPPRFAAGLASWQDPTHLGPLGHYVIPDAPAGTVTVSRYAPSPFGQAPAAMSPAARPPEPPATTAGDPSYWAEPRDPDPVSAVQNTADPGGPDLGGPDPETSGPDGPAADAVRADPPAGAVQRQVDGVQPLVGESAPLPRSSPAPAAEVQREAAGPAGAPHRPPGQQPQPSQPAPHAPGVPTRQPPPRPPAIQRSASQPPARQLPAVRPAAVQPALAVEQVPVVRPAGPPAPEGQPAVAQRSAAGLVPEPPAVPPPVGRAPAMEPLVGESPLVPRSVEQPPAVQRLAVETGTPEQAAVQLAGPNPPAAGSGVARRSSPAETPRARPGLGAPLPALPPTAQRAAAPTSEAASAAWSRPAAAPESGLAASDAAGFGVPEFDVGGSGPGVAGSGVVGSGVAGSGVAGFGVAGFGVPEFDVAGFDAGFGAGVAGAGVGAPREYPEAWTAPAGGSAEAAPAVRPAYDLGGPPTAPVQRVAVEGGWSLPARRSEPLRPPVGLRPLVLRVPDGMPLPAAAPAPEPGPVPVRWERPGQPPASAGEGSAGSDDPALAGGPAVPPAQPDAIPGGGGPAASPTPLQRDAPPGGGAGPYGSTPGPPSTVDTVQLARAGPAYEPVPIRAPDIQPGGVQGAAGQRPAVQRAGLQGPAGQDVGVPRVGLQGPAGQGAGVQGPTGQGVGVQRAAGQGAAGPAPVGYAPGSLTPQALAVAQFVATGVQRATEAVPDPPAQAAADPAPEPAAGQTPAPQTPTPQSTPAHATPAAGPVVTDEFVRALYDPLSRLLRAELRLERERAGLLVDTGR